MVRSARAWLWILSLVCLLASASTFAALTVIADTGQTERIAQYIEPFNAEDAMSEPPVTDKPAIGAADPETWLPIRSPGLVPGPVERRSHARPFTRPFFLVGSDPRSWRWLRKNQSRLNEIGAVGMLVQAETVGDLQAIIELARGLPILPASASDIAKALNLAHYPVLISPHAIEQ